MISQPPRRVVVVDDEEGILRLCERLLERAGFEVEVFRQPYEALDYFQEHQADVLVVDTRMPEMDGFALMEQARLRQPNLAVVIMTGFATMDMALAAFNHGADGLLLKPFESGSELVQSVWRGLANRRRQEETARLAALRPLFDVAEALLAETRLEPLQALIVQKVHEVLPSTAVGLYVWDDEHPSGQILASVGEVADPGEPLLPSFQEYPQPWNVKAEGPGSAAQQALLEKYGWFSVLLAPVTRAQHQYALLAARHQPPLFHPQIDATALGILARLAAAALENARLYEDLRESLAQLERSQRALAQTEKMAAIGRLTASLAHEVNNPIQAVRNSLYLAAHPDVDAARRQAYIHAARQEIERLSVLVHRMLNFYRPGNVERQWLSVKDLVVRVVSLLEGQLAEQHIRVNLEIPDGLPPVAGVEDQLQQVLLNLVINAMEAMPDGGTLYFLAWKEKTRLILSIEDTGPGVPWSLRDRIFEPLVSTKEEGTGLGLAVSYNILAAHEGDLLLAEPRRGSGAAFHVVLPLTLAKDNLRPRDIVQANGGNRDLTGKNSGRG